MVNFIYEHLNYFLYILAILLTLVEGAFKWLIPSIRKNPQMAGWVETVDSLWIALIVALSLKAVWVQPFTIPSGSMEDTLLVGDYILVKKYEYGYSIWNSTDRFLQHRKPQHRDIVVFVYPGDHTKDYIKRCIGLPGDVIEVKDKDLYVNGTKQEESYVKHIDPNTYPRGYLSVDRDNFGPVTVLPDHYFMMGDNRDNSADSRYWGQLDEKLIKGRAWLIYWHSLSVPQLLTVIGLVVAGGSILLLLLGMALTRINSRKTAVENAPPTVKPEEEGMTPKQYLYLIIFSLVVVGIIYVSNGRSPEFKEGFQTLKDRVFTVIR